MKNYILILLLITCSIAVYSQERKLRGPIWTFNQPHVDVFGISLGIGPKEIFRDTTLSRTFGVRIDLNVLGLLSPLLPKSPLGMSSSDQPQEVINGINISTGSFDISTNGLSLGLLMQYHYRSNGVSIAGLTNVSEIQNGIAISALGNDIDTLRGVSVGFINDAFNVAGIQIGGANDIKTKGVGIQIGVFNKATNFKGIQLGLWNENDKRSLPILNWNFK